LIKIDIGSSDLAGKRV